MKAPPAVSELTPPAERYTYFERASDHPFEAAATDWSPRNATWLADLALLSYAQRAFAFPRLAAAGFEAESNDDVARNTPVYYVVHSPAEIIVVFRGTELGKVASIAEVGATFRRVATDIILDAQVGPSSLRPGRTVHGGFLRGFESVREAVMRVVERLQHNTPRPIWFTGHSLGAALATLAADWYAREIGRPAGLYTFGSPLVGDATFAREFSVPAFRVVNNQDVVARIPPPPPSLLAALRLASFVHVGRPMVISPVGAIHPGDVPPLSLTAGPLDIAGIVRDGIRGLPDLLLGAGPIGWFTDHAPVWYATHLWNGLATP